MSRPWEVDLPESWRRKPFWTEFRRAKTLGDGNEEMLSVYRDYGVIPKASRDDNFNKASEDLSKYQLVARGDLVINKMKAWQGSLGVSAYDGIVSPAYFVYKGVGSLNRRFAHYLLRSRGYADHMAAISSGIRPNQWDLDPLQLSATPLLVPPVAEQEAIADFLDRETARIDAFIAKNIELITLLTERRATVIRRALMWGSQGVAPNTSPVDHDSTEGTSQWDASGLLRYASTISGVGFPEVEQGLEGEPIAFYKVNALGRADRDGVIRASWDTISYATAGRLRATVLPAGSLVMAKIGAALLLGRVRRTSRLACIDNNMMALIPTSDLDSQFAAYVVETMDFALFVNPGAVPSLNTYAFMHYKVGVPPIETQREIVRHLDAAVLASHTTVETVERAINLARERRAALISAAVTGKFDVGVAG